MPGYVKAIALMSSGLGDEVGDSVMIGGGAPGGPSHHHQAASSL